ncbi:MAG: hypothetical protein O2890_00440 [Cyanobacteria bacterium]|nr:hypothetical protein [Cyanobacteriota bacterium]MDA0864899.1 hypothetical protein [Cyanobacteriota bacterium]
MELSRVIDEIKRIPQDRLSEVYSFIHCFRLGLESGSPQSDVSDLAIESTQKSSSPPSNYDFSDLVGRLTWQGDALATQRSLRDEW